MNAIVRGEGATSYFYGDTFNPQAPEMERFFEESLYRGVILLDLPA